MHKTMSTFVKVSFLKPYSIDFSCHVLTGACNGTEGASMTDEEGGGSFSPGFIAAGAGPVNPPVLYK